MDWMIVIILFIMTILFLSGKGSFLIAGYNTASKADQAKYDEKKLCRVVGLGMGVITCLTAVSMYFEDSAPEWFFTVVPVIIVLVVIVMLVLCNTICKAKNPPVLEESEEEKRKQRVKERRVWIFVAAAFILVGILLVTGDIETTADNENIYIKASYWKDKQIALDDVKNITYREALGTGKRVGGFGSFKLAEGSFRNDEFDNYTLYAYENCDTYIVLDTSDGILVINAKTEEQTRELYENLVHKLGKNP